MVVAPCFVELQVTGKTPITLKNRNAATDSLMKL